jgi:4'-phosphopantetheinyl transferase
LVSDEVAGCDLEQVEPRSAGFVSDFLTRAEASYVDNTVDPAEAANLIWSAKESALKVLRTGLRLDTREVEVTVQTGQTSGWSPLRVRVPGGRRLPGWWRRGGEFVLTVVCRSEAPPPVPLGKVTGPFSTPAPG